MGSALGSVSVHEGEARKRLQEMGFLGRILRFLFWVLIVSWALRLLGRVIGGAKATRTAPGRPEAEPAVNSKRLVKDPVCGMHMAQELALPLMANGEMLHFCSEECRAKYESSMVRRAASA
jgi:YHS domain-containing protein